MSEQPDQPPQPSEQEREKARFLWGELRGILAEQYHDHWEDLDALAHEYDLPQDLDLLMWPLMQMDPVWAIERLRVIGPEFNLEDLDKNDQYELARGVILVLTWM